MTSPENAAELALRRATPVPAAEAAAPERLTTGDVLRAVGMVGEGRVYDLARVRYKGMPLPPMHPPFEIMTYRTPAGLRAEPDTVWPSGADNSAEVGFITEMVMTCTHVGTHIDALAHITVGADGRWFGGHDVKRHLGDFGPLHADGSQLPPMVTRGVLVDVARSRGVDALDAGYGITVGDLENALDAGDVGVAEGDVVLIRTGYGSVWPDTERMKRHHGAGITVQAARWLADAGAVAIGTDTEGVEQLPSVVPGNPHPVHSLLLTERGVPLIEMLDLEMLAADSRHTFMFVGLPTKIRGSTGALMDPVAIV